MAGAAPRLLIVMGVSGSGKTTVGKLLAARLAYGYAEADDFHPPANVEKMKHDHPLTDADRAPWLAAIHAYAVAHLASGENLVITCSALKRAYRDVLFAGVGGARLVYLRGDRATIAARLAARKGHFFPPNLLASQFATLEEPDPDENAVVVDIGPEPEKIVEEIVRAL